MKVPPSSVGSEGRSSQPLRVQPVGLTAAVAAVASCMLVAVALAGFTPSGIRAGRANSELLVPGPIQVLDPISREASSASGSRTPPASVGPISNISRDAIPPSIAAPPSVSRATGRDAVPSIADASVGPTRTLGSAPPRVPEIKITTPNSPVFDSPFEANDVRRAQEVIATEVRRTLANIPLKAKPNYSGLLQFSAQATLASLSRQSVSEQLQADAAVSALRGVTDAPIRHVMVQSASTAFDAAIVAQRTGVSGVALERVLRRTFRVGITRGF
ncbi:MAG: hypothetical protein ACRC0L_06415, partial [Angustibacter sp.]